MDDFIFELLETVEAEEGEYFALIQEAKMVNVNGETKLMMSFRVFDDGGTEYASKNVWFDQKPFSRKLLNTFIEALGCDGYNLSEFQKEYVGTWVRMIISDYEKNGLVYHNVVEFSEAEEPDFGFKESLDNVFEKIV